MAEQYSLGTTSETNNIMRLMRNRTKCETKEFLDELSKHVKIVLDSLQGSQKVFYLIQSDMAKSTVTIRFGSTLGLNDLPQEVQHMVAESEAKLRAREDGDGSKVLEMKLEGTIPQKPSKPLTERIREIEEARPEPKGEKKQ